MHEPLPEDLKTALNSDLEALKAAEEAPGVSVELLRFTEKVAIAQTRAQAAIRAGGTKGSEDGDEQGLRLDEFRFDSKVLRDLLGGLEEAADGSVSEIGVSVLVRAVNERPEILEAVTRACLPGGDARILSETARELELPVEALLLVGRLLAAPFVHEARLSRGASERLDARDAEGREAGRCPACGALPGLAVLDKEDGARKLLCSLCGELWVAPRLMCTACGNKEQSKLGTLCLDENDPRWIEVCDVCRRYLKTVDESRLGADDDVRLRAEDARTVHLDILAEEEGYVRSTF